MNVTIREEAGYNLALYGMSLSFKDRAIKPEDWWDFKYKTIPDVSFNLPPEADSNIEKRMVRMKNVTTVNANRGNGHNKFRRQVMLWVDIEAPRFWWSEFDTYKIGTVAQSESTMHTLMKRDATEDDFDSYVWKDYLDQLNYVRKNGSIDELKGDLKESYLQRRLVTLNYEVLAAIINQREKHRLPQWEFFIKEIYNQVEHKELLPEYPYEV